MQTKVLNRKRTQCDRLVKLMITMIMIIMMNGENNGDGCNGYKSDNGYGSDEIGNVVKFQSR